MSADDHGSVSTYKNHKCRCDECREANRAQTARDRTRRLARRVRVEGFGESFWVHPDAPHGTTGASQNYGCYCPECRAAGRDAKRADRQRDTP